MVVPADLSIIYGNTYLVIFLFVFYTFTVVAGVVTLLPRLLFFYILLVR